MNRYILLMILFVSTSTKAQVLEKGSFYISGSIGKLKPNTFQELNIKPLMYEFKIGYSVLKNLSIGVNFQNNKYENNYVEKAALQQPGSLNTDVGIRTVKYSMVGVNMDYHFKISKKLVLISSLFLDKINSTDVMAGEYYSNNLPTGTTHTFTRNHGYKIAVGLNLNLEYLINNKIAISLRFAEYQYRTKSFESKSFLAAPIMLGLNYHFKPNFK